MIERRNYKRYNVKSGVLAEIKTGSVKVGQIANISRGGLAFNYVDIGDRSSGDYHVNIWTDNELFMEKVPLSTTADYKIPEVSLFNCISMRQRCGKFNNLTDEQRHRISDLLNNYTCGEVESGNR